MKIAAAYVRVSTDDQLMYSPDSQIAKIQEYAERNGYLLPPGFLFREEEGVSGRGAEKRPGFQRMIETAKRKPKPFDVILVWKFSRFARSRQDSIVYKSLLRRQCGIDVISVTEPIGHDKTSVLFEAIIEAMDEYYSANLAEEVRRGMEEKARRGEPVSAPPVGYRMAKNRFEVDPEAARTVRMIFHLCAQGCCCREIALRLNAAGFSTRRGCPWESRTVEYVLRNPVYTGRVRWRFEGREELAEALHEPLVSQELFDEAQRRLGGHKKMYAPGARHESGGNPFRGLIRCSACGAALSLSSRKALQCSGYTHGRCGESHSIAMKRMAGLICAVLQNDLHEKVLRLDAPGEVAAAVPGPGASHAARQARRLARLRAAYEAGVESLEEYRREKAAIQAQIAALELEEAERRREPTPALPAELPFWVLFREDGALNQELSLFLHAVVKQIVFDRGNNRVQIYYQA